MIINENGWGDKGVKPIETDKDKFKKAKLVKEEVPVKATVDEEEAE
jgi:hypothetical protein